MTTSCTRVGFITFFILFVSMSTLLVQRAAATDYAVGYDYGWDVPPNNSSDFYASWASNLQFTVGDAAVFTWIGNHTATEVTKAGYDRCNKSDVVRRASDSINVTGNGDRVHFTSPGVFYFICTVGTHCEQNQKITFNVTDASSAPPPATFAAFFAVLFTLLATYFVGSCA